MSDTIAPESRIFRIGRECYVVYLGKERDDIRPFLRIGNIRDIPDDVHQVISTTVVTDDHVGNPLLEILNAPKFPGRYLGDTAVVGEIRKFFQSFDLPTDEVTDYRKVKDGEKRHMVWFYSSGNIHLRYDDHVIFDLQKREKEDRHFVRLYEEAKAEFLRNPLRYIRQDFNGPGMILTEGNAFWYESGEILSLAAHPGFVARLMKDGMDPDFISASVYDLTEEDMASRDAAVYIGFVKRMRQRRKQLRVLTSRPDIQRKLRLLFPARGDVPATLDVTDVSGKKKATFRDSIISRKNDLWCIHRAGLPEISMGGGPENGISVNIDEGRITVNAAGNHTVYRAPQGCPIDFLGHPVPENQMIDRYVGYIAAHIKDHLGEGENQAVTALEKYIRLLKDDISSGKASVSPLLKQNASAVRDAVRRAEVPEGGLSWYFYSNAKEVLGIMAAALEEDHALGKNADQIITVLNNLLGRISHPDPIFPFWGDMYVTDKPNLLWRATKRTFAPADLVSTRDVNAKISEITSLDETPWNDDLERLLQLIRSLGEGGRGPLTQEQMALLNTPENEKAKTDSEKKKAPALTEAAAGAAAEKSVRDNQGTAAVESSRVDSGGKRKKSGGSGRKWLWILLVLLLLLIGGAIAWDLSGHAPWGGLLTSEGHSRVDRDRQDTDASGAAMDGDEATDSGADSESPTPDGKGVSDGTAAGGDAVSDSGTGDGSTDTVVTDSGTGDSTASGIGTPDSSDSPGSAADTATDSGSAQSDSDSSPEAALPIDVDVAPRTISEVKAYLDVNGRVPITEADIHLAANEIAVLNGYKDLDYKVFTGEDPDWIYPGNTLQLPDANEYVIRRGDTIWFLAAREVRIGVEADLMKYDSSVAILKSSTSSDEEISNARDILAQIASESRALVMREMAAKSLTSL